MFESEVLLITGGTGTFGNAVLRRFLDTSICEIRVFSRDEKKQEDMRLALKNPKVKFIIGDVRDYDSLLPAMQGVDYVFHAAASNRCLPASSSHWKPCAPMPWGPKMS